MASSAMYLLSATTATTGSPTWRTRSVAIAYWITGGLAKLARDTTISRRALHEALSPDGNPRLRTFQSVLEALGLKMSFKAAHGHALVR